MNTEMTHHASWRAHVTAQAIITVVHTLSHADHHATDFTVWQQVAALSCLEQVCTWLQNKEEKRDGGMSRRL